VGIYEILKKVIPLNSVNQLLFTEPDKNVEVWVKRDDLLHPFVSGNKFRKLKYNLSDAAATGSDRLLTFGGAFSNHIAAVSYAGKEGGFKTIGIIRGDEITEEQITKNPTLAFARSNGMQFVFVSREEYRQRNESDYIEILQQRYGPFFLIPEGGTNLAAVKGCMEILTDEDMQFNVVCCAVGTGGTLAGLINSSHITQKILGFPALKGSFLNDEIRKFAINDNWQLITDYDFGGYAKVNRELIVFMNDFFKEYKLLLDPVYTAKLFFGVMDMVRKKVFPENSKLLLIHTGGLQGIAGMNLRLLNKQLPTINTHD
jgi:1-aminocyclopropane-1-carboxylate deaminase